MMVNSKDVIEIAKTITLAPTNDRLEGYDEKTGMVHPYHDPVGYPTIGYGHLLSTKQKEPLSKFPPITKQDAISFLEKDLDTALQGVLRYTSGVDLNANQLAALTDFVFNAGIGNFKNSTLLGMLNSGDYVGASGEFERWVYGTDKTTGKKVKLPGLVARRAMEKALFDKPVR